MALSALAETWFVKVRSDIFGPYPRERIRGFIAEGRVRARTLVAAHPADRFAPAEEFPELADMLAPEMPVRRTPPEPRRAQGPLATFFIVADVEKDTLDMVEDLLNTMGPCTYAAHGVWMVRAATTAELIRNTLTKVLTAEDTLIIVDATRDRAAWFNIGQDRDAALRALREEA